MDCMAALVAASLIMLHELHFCNSVTSTQVVSHLRGHLR
ncbi:hypothetical protein ID866_5748 [Astraeus odoratus]|nr:hypothetical protein ID866_5748 [Astraeus odoratus]